MHSREEQDGARKSFEVRVDMKDVRREAWTGDLFFLPSLGDWYARDLGLWEHFFCYFYLSFILFCSILCVRSCLDEGLAWHGMAFQYSKQTLQICFFSLRGIVCRFRGWWKLLLLAGQMLGFMS